MSEHTNYLRSILQNAASWTHRVGVPIPEAGGQALESALWKNFPDGPVVRFGNSHLGEILVTNHQVLSQEGLWPGLLVACCSLPCASSVGPHVSGTCKVQGFRPPLPCCGGGPHFPAGGGKLLDAI